MPAILNKPVRVARMSKMPLGDVFYNDLVKSDYFTISTIIDNSIISNQDDAYYLFMKNWNEVLFPSVQEYKAILINGNLNAFAMISFQEHRVVKVEAVKVFFQKIKELAPDRIIIGQNHPYKPFDVDADAIKTSKLFKDQASKSRVRLFDHLIVSKLGYFALPGFEEYYKPLDNESDK